MRQLLLDLGAEKPPTLDSFVVGRNAELLHRLQEFAARADATPAERFIYLWGDPGAGKTHLLQALATGAGTLYLNAQARPAAFAMTPGVALYLLDDCDALDARRQVNAFTLYNQVRDSGGLMLAAGSLPPAQLPLREDLRTRLGWGLIYHLHGLTDEEKIAALTQAAQARGITLPPGVLPYLITHFRRDMRSLSAMLDALDQYSLETKRPITLPLLRDLLQLEIAYR